ncbi:hypothetical protein KCP69_16190 [Salmonella enterica subsp. enterica]|nr:hypothetical protein KCP69_16190 [Salmonella enterica subsp. enterica]
MIRWAANVVMGIPLYRFATDGVMKLKWEDKHPEPEMREATSTFAARWNVARVTDDLKTDRHFTVGNARRTSVPKRSPQQNARGIYFDPDASRQKRSASSFDHPQQAVLASNLPVFYVHERVTPVTAINLAKTLEQSINYFILRIRHRENIDWLKMLRQQSSTRYPWVSCL